MKQLKKLTSILLALVMMLALGATAFAADTAKGETYNAYKIFDATINGNHASYSIDKNSEWLSDVQSYTGEGLTLTESADGTKMLVTVSDDFNATTFAAYLAAKTTGKTAAKTEAGTEEGVTITGLADGYYLITSSLGSLCQLTTGGSLTIVEKNTVPDVDKKIDTKDAYAQIGDVIPFTITITDGTGTNKAITLHDQMSEALTLNKDSFQIKVNDTAVDASNYTLTYPTSGDTFTIAFTAEYVASLDKDAKIVVTYNATLNEKAVSVNKITNKASIDYSNQSNTDTSEVEVKTNSFAVLKYASDDSTKSNLAGATFRLKQGDNVIGLIKVSDTEYRVALDSEKNAEAYTETFTTVANGNITIKGVDSDLDYTLVETVAPAGYNLLTSSVSVNVAEDNSTVSEIANSAGSTLPITGGMGTTLLYAIGIILVLGAGVTLVVRRRMNVSR